MNVRGVTANKTDLADMLNLQVRAMRLPPAIREYHAIPGRRFRSDLFWKEHGLFAEVNGGEWNGRHNRQAGMTSDYEKHALLVLAGFQGFWFTGGQVKNGFAIQTLQQWFAAHPSP